MPIKWNPSQDQAKPFIELYEMGYSAQQIIDQCDIPLTAVSFVAWLRRQGVEIRSNGSGKRIECIKCGISFNSTQGSQKYCVDCGSTYKNRANILKHGITEEQYEFLLKRSGGCCELCGFKPLEGYKALAIDHDHETGLIRGLLCRNCNLMLGWIDNKNYMQKVEAYKNAEHMEPVFIGRGHPDHNGEDYRRNPNYRKVVMQDHG